jgi:hypothetical protein
MNHRLNTTLPGAQELARIWAAPQPAAAAVTGAPYSQRDLVLFTLAALLLFGIDLPHLAAFFPSAAQVAARIVSSKLGVAYDTLRLLARIGLVCIAIDGFLAWFNPHALIRGPRQAAPTTGLSADVQPS